MNIAFFEAASHRLWKARGSLLTDEHLSVPRPGNDATYHLKIKGD